MKSGRETHWHTVPEQQLDGFAARPQKQIALHEISAHRLLVIVREDALGKTCDHRGLAHLAVADHDDLALGCVCIRVDMGGCACVPV
jgi:hypothetical protein